MLVIVVICMVVQFWCIGLVLEWIFVINQLVVVFLMLLVMIGFVVWVVVD